MPKIIAHALTGAAIVAVLDPKAGLVKWTPLFIGALLAVAPDFDYALEWIFKLPDAHRGFTHSLFFSLLVGVLICLLMPAGEERAALGFSLAYLSHALLDFSTSTTGGVKLLWPLSNQYYNYGVTGILELPVGKSLSEMSKWIILEMLFFLPLLGLILLLKRILR